MSRLSWPRDRDLAQDEELHLWSSSTLDLTITDPSRSSNQYQYQSSESLEAITNEQEERISHTAIPLEPSPPWMPEHPPSTLPGPQRVSANSSVLAMPNERTQPNPTKEKHREAPLLGDTNPPIQPNPSPGEPPDGGLEAWIIVAGSWCCLFVSFGWITCIGDFQSYYSRQLLSSYSPSTIAWIPSVETCLLFLGAPVFGKVFDSYGPRPLLLLGTFFHILGLVLLSFCREYYQVFLAQAVFSAVGASAIFWASNNAVGTWFRRRRAFAMGIVSSGSSVGGVVGTASIPTLLERIGFAETIRATAFLYLALLAFALVTVKSRLVHKPKPFRFLDVVAPLRNGYLIKLSLAAFFFFLGVFLPYNFLVEEGIDAGMSESQATNLLVVLSATSIIGRIVPAWAGDRLGRFNVTIFFTLLSALFTLVLWIPAPENNSGARMAYAALYGITSGVFVSLMPTLVVEVCPDMRQVGVFSGATYLAASPAILIAQPIGGALVRGDDGIGIVEMYVGMKVFAGLMMGIGGLLFVVARAAHMKQRNMTGLKA